MKLELKNKIHTIFSISEKVIKEETCEQLIAYAHYLNEWNLKINLISRKDSDFFFEQHLAPCLIYYLSDFIHENDYKLIDIGTGGGLPGMVLAIMYPDKEITLLDATQKKITVLLDITQKLGLKNVACLWGRAEQLGFNNAYHFKFDLATSRGLAGLKNIINWSLPFLKKEGSILALKGGDLSNEYTEIKRKSNFEILEYEPDSRFYYIERYKTLKIVEISRKER